MNNQNKKRNLIIIAGSSCVGKSEVAEKLFYSLENSSWIDGDQVWWSNKS